MRSTIPLKAKCFFVAWVFGWFIAVVVPSVLIAVTGLSTQTQGVHLLRDVFDVADEVSPAAKLSFAVAFAGALIFVRVLLSIRTIYLDASVGMVCMLVVVALLPVDWSGGFGVGLSGSRFAPLPTVFYALGGLLAGATVSISETRCIRKSVATVDH